MLGRMYIRTRKRVTPLRVSRIQRSLHSNVNFSSREISEVTPNDNNLFRRKLNELVVWYEQVTGMDEVRMMQNRVIEAQDKFVAAQENRRNLATQLMDVQNKLKEVQAELNTVSRGEERYLQLVTEEHRILKEEKRIESKFTIYERDERETFHMLSSRLKESHEKERAQANRTKYWSVIGSVLGTLLGFAGSSINNQLKMKELRQLVESSALNKSAGGSLSFQQLTSLLADVKESLTRNSDGFLHHVGNSNKQIDLAGQIRRIENGVHELTRMMKGGQTSNVNYLLERQRVDTRNQIIKTSLFVLAVSAVLTFWFR